MTDLFFKMQSKKNSRGVRDPLYRIGIFSHFEKHDSIYFIDDLMIWSSYNPHTKGVNLSSFVFYGFKNIVQSIWLFLKNQDYTTQFESKSYGVEKTCAKIENQPTYV